MGAYPASDKQVGYIHDLFDQKNLFADPAFFDRVNAMDHEEYARYIEYLKDQVGHRTDRSIPRVSSDRASAIIDKLKELPWKPRGERGTAGGEPGTKPVNAERGMWLAEGGEIIRVYLGQQSGRNLAKQLVDTDRPHPDDPNIHLHDWEYIGAAEGAKAQRLLRSARRMTPEEAVEFGRMSGSCAVCGRRLDVPESVERGIGPVCWGRITNNDWS